MIWMLLTSIAFGQVYDGYVFDMAIEGIKNALFDGLAPLEEPGVAQESPIRCYISDADWRDQEAYSLTNKTEDPLTVYFNGIPMIIGNKNTEQGEWFASGVVFMPGASCFIRSAVLEELFVDTEEYDSSEDSFFPKPPYVRIEARARKEDGSRKYTIRIMTNMKYTRRSHLTFTTPPLKKPKKH